jgi:hypothetical protein
MNTITFLVIILMTPSGERVETRQEFTTRTECRTQFGLAYAAMHNKDEAKGYTLVSADCENKNDH